MKVIKSIIKNCHVTIIMIIKSMYQNIKEIDIAIQVKKRRVKKLYMQKTGIIIYLKIKKKNIKRAYAKNRYHSMHHDKMLELKAYQKEYQRKYQEMKKAQGNLAKNAVLTP